MVSSTRERLIQYLAESTPTYVSGQWLSEKLDISRTAVWKQIKQLEADGYVFQAIPNKGYRLLNMPDKISSNTLTWGLKTSWLAQQLEHFTSLDSTQDLAKEKARENKPHGYTVVADHQLKGRGRMGRVFESNNPNGLWFSMVLRPNLIPMDAPKLTLVAAVSLVRVIKEMTHLEAEIKWPNDVFIQGKKTAGILTEMQGEQDRINFVVIGIGININQTASDFDQALHARVTSLRLEQNQEIDRRQFLQLFFEQFERDVDHFIQHGFADTKKRFLSDAYKLNQKISLITEAEQREVIYEGISDHGAILIRDGDVLTEHFNASLNWN